ncbi:hypothetical protein SAMN05444267_104129 [Chryseobacterium polytrichastri]|uniref:Uncharacterized protein n=1 Tax=Chryseobacterium polytrichastri TaxID=1302687 RepID=A0A1M7HMN0_9FLAO|nr:hypothetical protein SAMN05444267_104129 [Chryseobacterium polytrichastri]
MNSYNNLFIKDKLLKSKQALKHIREGFNIETLSYFFMAIPLVFFNDSKITNLFRKFNR